MTKSDFKKHIIVSSLLAAAVAAAIIFFCISMFAKYSMPTEENTSVASGTVADVHAAKRIGVVIELSDNEELYLVYPFYRNQLFDAIGYDMDELSHLLEGKQIQYLRMDRMPWILEMDADGTVIDNRALTAKQINATRIGTVILGLIMLAFPLCGEVAYIKAKYRIYKKAEKKRIRHAKRMGLS